MYAKVKYSDIPQDEGAAPSCSTCPRSSSGAPRNSSTAPTSGTGRRSFRLPFAGRRDCRDRLLAGVPLRRDDQRRLFDRHGLLRQRERGEGHRRTFSCRKAAYPRLFVERALAGLPRLGVASPSGSPGDPHEGRSWRSFRRAGSKAVIGRWRAIPSCGAATIRPSPRPSRSWRSTAPGAWPDARTGARLQPGQLSWNWNDEMFANFRMQYGLEQNQGKVWMDERVFTPGARFSTCTRRITTIWSTRRSKWGQTTVSIASVVLPGGIGWEPFKAAP